jgi:hypothetical protein
MGVQTYASLRNEQVEYLVDFVLRNFVQKLKDEGYVSSSQRSPVQQKQFTREDCNDIFDHYLELDLVRPMGNFDQKIELWAQTTSYKGNMTGKPEPNKTYEIRETLVEGLTARDWLTTEHRPFRIIHFTVGPSNYTYGWIKLAKDHVFDLSLYPDVGINSPALFAELANVLSGGVFNRDRLARLVNQPGSQVGVYVKTITDALYEWFTRGLPSSPLADKQAALLAKLRNDRRTLADAAVVASQQGGANIKQEAVTLLSEGGTTNQAMLRTLARLNSGNPFLALSLEAEIDWPNWVSTNLAIPVNCSDLEKYLQHLWTMQEDKKLLSRRLLLRIHTDDVVNYVQDIDVEGVTEHNLYNGAHTSAQVSVIVNQIAGRCRSAGINSPAALFQRLRSNRGRELSRASRRLESRNGTTMRPSFFYIEESLSDQYQFVSFRDTNLSLPIAYHSAFGSAKVEPYDNMKVILRRQGDTPIAIIKAKYFNKPEFPRRAKEEGYVGLTTKYQYTNSAFQERYPGTPLIMFIDMNARVKPAEHAVRRLVTLGWDVFFKVDSLRVFLDQLPRQRS